MRIEPSMLDQLEAMIRHPAFRRSLALWRSIFEKNYVGLTDEEEFERDAPRTKIRLAAIAEADDQWLTRSIQDIRKHGEANWAWEAVNGPFGDDTNTGSVPAHLRIPLDLPKEDIARWFLELVSQQRKQRGIVPTQRPRPHEVDKWEVYDLRKEGRTFWAITRHLFNLSGKITYDSGAQAHYRKVYRAYRAACQMIQALGKQ